MPSPHDETPPYGTEIPEELPTSPALPAAQVRCFSCLGEGMTLRVVERDPDGAVTKRSAETCVTCRGTKSVSRAAWAEWHATREGRPK
jgi:hypothetical protein